MAYSDSNPSNLAQLSQTDGAALDDLLDCRGKMVDTDRSESKPELAKRRNAVKGLLALLDHDPVPEPPTDLVERTLRRVRDSSQRARFAQQIEALSGPPIRFRLSDLIAVAAAFLIAGSLALPMLSQNQAHARRVACASHQGTAGMALAQYAADNNQALPRGPVKHKSAWYKVGPNPIGPDGTFHSNSAHLRLIIKRGYIHPKTLTCPGNNSNDSSVEATDWASYDQVPFSYVNQFSTKVIRIHLAPNLAILADKNPQFRVVGNGTNVKSLLRQPGLAPDAPSDQHGGAGQNVLTASGSVYWSAHPTLPNRDDNIYLMQGVDQYQGTEAPDDPLNDAFLVP